MTNEELIRMMRSDPTWLGQESADCIEELVKELDKQVGYKEDYKAALVETSLQLHETEAKLARAVKALAWFFYADATSSQKDVARAALAELERETK